MSSIRSITMGTYSVLEPTGLFLTGITIAQYGFYLRQDYPELRFNKILVTVAMLSIIAVSIVCYWATINNFHDMIFQVSGSLTRTALALETLFNALCGICTQIYFIRIAGKMINASLVWWAFCGTLIVAISLGSAMEATSLLRPNPNPMAQKQPKAYEEFERVGYGLWLGGSAFLDTMLSCILCYKFWGDKRESEFGATTSVLATLIISTIETFTMTSMAALAGLIVNCLTTSGLHGLRLQMVSTTINTLLSRFYVISLFFSLNRRAALRTKLKQRRDYKAWSKECQARRQHPSMVATV